MTGRNLLPIANLRRAAVNGLEKKMTPAPGGKSRGRGLEASLGSGRLPLVTLRGVSVDSGRAWGSCDP